MSSEPSYTPEEAASIAFVQWNDEAGALSENGAGVPSVYLQRVREDAAMAAFGDFLPDLARADAVFRNGVEMYLKHQAAGTEGSEFLRAFLGKLDEVLPVMAAMPLGETPALEDGGFWPRLEQRIDAARSAFAGGVVPGESVLADERRQNAAIFTTSVLAAGELVGRGRISKEAALPMRMLERMPTTKLMRGSAVPERCATVYGRALQSVGIWQAEAATLCAAVGNTPTALAIAPILVSARRAMTLGEFKEASGKSRNTVETFLEQLRKKAFVVADAWTERGAPTKTYRYLFRTRGRGADTPEVSSKQVRATAALPAEKKMADKHRGQAR